MKDYRYYIRDVNISDEQYINLIDDIITEIAYQTNIFKKEIMFDVIPDQKYYDMNAILASYEKNTYSVITVDTSDVNDTGDYSKALNSIIDIRLYDTSRNNNLKKDPIDSNVSVIGSDFIIENTSVVKYIGEKLRKSNWRRYFAILSFIPTIKQIKDQRELKIQKALIAGLRYKANSMYTDQNDQNYIIELKKNYEYELNILKNLEPMNAYWQTKNRSWQ